MVSLAERSRERVQSEEGAVTTEVAVLFPIVLFVLLVFMQAVLWMHASNVAQVGAAQALEAATSYNNRGDPAGSGQTAGMAFLTAAGGITEAVVAVRSGPSNIIEVQVTGSSPRLIPGGGWGVDVTVAGPAERFVEVSPE